MDTRMDPCPCGCKENLETATKGRARKPSLFPSAAGSKTYASCCKRYLDGSEAAPTAEALMRSRYTAYTLDREDYLLATWIQGTRPPSLALEAGPFRKWLGLDVKRHEQTGPDEAIVEFVARYKLGGRAFRLHEISRFVREGGRWFYVAGDMV